MFEIFTDRSKRILALSNQEAQRLNHEYIDVHHLLLGIAKEESGVGGFVLKSMGFDLTKIRLTVEKLIKCGPEMVTMGKLPQTDDFKKTLSYAVDEAKSLKHQYVGTEHLLLGLLKIAPENVKISNLFKEMNFEIEEIRSSTLELICEKPKTDIRNDIQLDPLPIAIHLFELLVVAGKRDAAIKASEIVLNLDASYIGKAEKILANMDCKSVL